MGKLDEIAELIINELSTFDKNLKIFNNDIQMLKTISIKPKVDNINRILEHHVKKMQQIVLFQEKKQLLLINKMNKSNSYPNWLIAIVFSTFLAAFFSILFSVFLYMEIDNSKEIAYKKGIDDFSKHINKFFEEHPESYQDYKKWGNK